MRAEEFKRAFAEDPYTAALTKIWIDAWALGFDAARREVSGGSSLDLDDYSIPDLRDRAGEALTGKKAEAERMHIVAMATIGQELPPEATP